MNRQHQSHSIPRDDKCFRMVPMATVKGQLTVTTVGHSQLQTGTVGKGLRETRDLRVVRGFSLKSLGKSGRSTMSARKNAKSRDFPGITSFRLNEKCK